MRLKYTILFVEDVAASIAFYERAFGLARRMIHESGDYGELDTGATTLSFSSLRLMTALGKTPGPRARGPVSRSLSRRTTCPRPGTGADGRGAGGPGVRAEPWGQTTAYVLDADGYLVEICSPVHGAS
jgi:catechol 2,3-dioxygenase-like lactoylglutathione lyase family enzyme